MNVVDSSGRLEYFADGANADFFAPAIEEVGELIVPTISLYEVFERILQQRGENAALQAVAAMQQGMVVEVDASVAIHAAKMSAALRIPMANSLILTTARRYDAIVWTQDADFKGLEGVQYIGKP